jgi:biopolymer transport protein TolR
MNYNKRHRYRPTAEINVVPYIDVMLVLLVIFMMTTPVLEQGVEIDLPPAKSQTLDFSQNEPIIVSVNKRGKFSINIGDSKKNISINSIVARVVAAIELDPNVQVMLRGDKNVNYGKVVELMGYLQVAGVEKIGFVTQSPDIQ